MQRQGSGFFSLGIVRGVLAMVVGTLLGIGIVTAARAILGLPAWSEPAWVLGAVFGAVAFLVGIGAFRDWIQWARGHETSEEHELQEPHPRVHQVYNLRY